MLAFTALLSLAALVFADETKPSSGQPMLLSSDSVVPIPSSSSEHPKLLSSEVTATIPTSSSEHPKLLSSDTTTTTSSEHSSIWTLDPFIVTRPPFGGNGTVTSTHSTLETDTSCSENDCHHSASVTSYEGAAAQAKYAAGAIAVAGALLL